MKGRFLAVARVVKAQGRHGEVAAEILTDFPRRFENLRHAYLESPSGEPAGFQLERAWPHKGRIVLKFAGVDSISSAQRLRGRLVLVPQSEKVTLPSGSYYVDELAGCRVVRSAGEGVEEIGTVTDVQRTGGVDLLRVGAAGAKKREQLIPLAETICTKIDIKARTIWIDPPEDLLDLNG